MTQRFNKNGILILDPPGNRRKKPRECLPGEHSPREKQRQWEWDFETVFYECRVCGMTWKEEVYYDV